MPINERLYDPQAYRIFMENQAMVSAEVLRPYEGMHIAWNIEGAEIVGFGESHDALFDQLDAKGIAVSGVRCDYVDRPGESIR